MHEYMDYGTAVRIYMMADLCIRKGFFSVSFFAVIQGLKSHVYAVIGNKFPSFVLLHFLIIEIPVYLINYI